MSDQWQKPAAFARALQSLISGLFDRAGNRRFGCSPAHKDALGLNGLTKMEQGGGVGGMERGGGAGAADDFERRAVDQAVALASGDLQAGREPGGYFRDCGGGFGGGCSICRRS